MRGRWFFGGIFFFFLLCWVFSTAVSASMVETPLNNEITTAGAGTGKVVFGVDYSDVFDRQLDSSGSTNLNAAAGRITASNQVHVKAVYAVNQYLNIYAKVGNSDWKENITFNTDGGKILVDYELAFSWGIGSTGGMRFSKSWIAFYDIQFLSTPDTSATNVKFIRTTNNNHAGEMEVNQFHLALGLGKEFHTYYEWASVIFPYIGVIFSTFTADHSSVTTPKGSFGDELDADDTFGIFGGIRFANESNWTLEVQGRVGDESSVSASLDYRF